MASDWVGLECECGNPKKYFMQGCKDCRRLDMPGTKVSNRVVDALRNVRWLTLDELAEATNTSTRSMLRCLNLMIKRKRVIKVLVDEVEFIDHLFGVKGDYLHGVIRNYYRLDA